MAVVFVHGLFSSAKVWEDFLALLRKDADTAEAADYTCFEYPTPRTRLGLRTRVPNLNTIADRLDFFLSSTLRDYPRIVLVGHSQGGLIIQRMLSRKVARGQARELARIRAVACFATPNNGSEYLLLLRKITPFLSRQERELRPLSDEVSQAQRNVVEGIVFAKGLSDRTCPIPFWVFAGESDAIVDPSSASWVFPNSNVISGDHSSIVRPDHRGHESFQGLIDVLGEAAEAPFPLSVEDAAAASTPPGRHDEMKVYPTAQIAFGDRRIPFTLHAGPVEQLRDVDVIVSPENTYLHMAPWFRPSISGRLRNAAARKTDAGAIVDDIAYEELQLWVKKQGRFGQQVDVGTVAPTSAGMLEVRGIQRIYHAALTIPVLGHSEYDVNPFAVSRVVHRVFEIARREREEGMNLRSICFPLLGAGSGGLEPETSFARLWAALDQELRVEGEEWDIRILEWRVDVAEMLHRELVSRQANC